jgi:hypothetical protein
MVRKRKVEGRPFAYFRFSPNPSTMPVDDALNMGAAFLVGVIPDNFLRRGWIKI